MKTRSAARSGIGIPELFGQILRGAVRKYGNDDATRQPLRDLEHSSQRGARGDPDQQPLFARETTDHAVGALAVDPQVLVGNRRIIYGRHHRRLHVFQSLEAMKRAAWLERNQADGWIELPQPPAGPYERAARPEAGDEMRQPAAGLLDDLRRGRVVVRAPVAVVAVLIRVEILVGLGRVEPAGFADGAVGALERVCQDQLRAKRAQNHFP